MRLKFIAYITTFSILFVWFPASELNAQKTLKERVIPLMQSDQLTKAELIVDSAIANGESLTDAWMLKGNLQYFKYNNTVNLLASEPNYNETIYNTAIGDVANFKEVIPKKVADSCIYYFQKALLIDSNRSDIHAGICYILSVSFQTDQLISYFPELLHHSNMTPSNLRDYAYNMIDRDSLIAGMKVFNAICNLDPENGNLVSDMAAEYYTHGLIDSAKAKVTLSLTKKHADATTWSNAFFLFGVTGEYNKAAYALKVESDLKDENGYKMYDAMEEMFSGNPAWKNDMEFFSKNAVDPKLQSLAAFLATDSLPDRSSTYDSIRAKGLNDGYNMIIYHHLFNKYPTSYYAVLNYAEALTHSYRYTDAIAIYKTLKVLPEDSVEREAFHFYYAWTLYKNNEIEKANQQWQQLLGSHNFYFKSASCYFLARYYYNKGDKKNAKYYCNLVQERKSESKYAGFCNDLLKRM